jgi:hypothetical protein
MELHEAGPEITVLPGPSKPVTARRGGRTIEAMGKAWGSTAGSLTTGLPAATLAEVPGASGTLQGVVVSSPGSRNASWPVARAGWPTRVWPPPASPDRNPTRETHPVGTT